MEGVSSLTGTGRINLRFMYESSTLTFGSSVTRCLGGGVSIPNCSLTILLVKVHFYALLRFRLVDEAYPALLSLRQLLLPHTQIFPGLLTLPTNMLCRFNSSAQLSSISLTSFWSTEIANFWMLLVLQRRWGSHSRANPGLTNKPTLSTTLFLIQDRIPWAHCFPKIWMESGFLKRPWNWQDTL